MEKKYELTDEIDMVYLYQFLNFLIDNILLVYICSNQVPKKHLESIADRLPKQSFLRALKTLTRCMRVAYKGFVGCSYAIQYPYGESIATDYRPCFLAPGIPLECQ
ncbi:hypothetical protein BM1374166_00341 [Bartonella tribocorum]|nr:hypothetical protein BM1374166_00341 [Bartonella tribocorum]